MFRKTVLVRALSIAFSSAALASAVMNPAMAQSNAAGSVFGKVASGTGDSIILKNNGTNQSRTSAIDANGSFSSSREVNVAPLVELETSMRERRPDTWTVCTPAAANEASTP
jgi:hypothetical protein